MLATPLTCLAALTALLAPGCEGTAGPPAARTVAPCTWSYFGDPRAVAVGSTVITGCVAPDGSAVIEAYDLDTGDRRLTRPFPRLEPDDHNNPSVVAFRDRVFAFSSPHSGYAFPLDRRPRMRYRSTARPHAAGGGWGPVGTVPLGKGCGLGYTYPNPVVSGDRLYLFMRGPCWSPYFTWTEDGVHWARPRTVVQAPPSGTSHRNRPYAKYAPGPGGSILMAFSDGHPGSWKSGLYYARLQGDRFYNAGGEAIGSVGGRPLRFEQLDRIHSPRDGSAWPMDVAWHPDGVPVVAYTSLRGTRDTFRYARWTGAGWATHRIAPAGRTLFTYHNSGATLDHDDPSRVVLSRTVGAQNEIEVHTTPDGGRSWSARQITRGSAHFNIRPVFPRGLAPQHRGLLLYVTGTARSYRDYDTTVVMRRV